MAFCATLSHTLCLLFLQQDLSTIINSFMVKKLSLNFSAEIETHKIDPCSIFRNVLVCRKSALDFSG
jgi:hypothetical protein